MQADLLLHHKLLNVYEKWSGRNSTEGRGGHNRLMSSPAIPSTPENINARSDTITKPKPR